MNLELAYDDIGQGDVLLLLHAFPFDRRFWHDVTPAFVSAGLRVIAPDLRGFGASHSNHAWSMADQAADVAALLGRLHIAKAHVLGLSMGGYVALALVAAHGAVVRSLCLAHTKAAPDSPAAREGRAAGIAKVTSEGVAAFADGMVTKLLAPGAPEAVRVRARSMMDQPPHTVLAALAALRDRPDRTAMLPAIRQPTLFLTGEHDGISLPSENQEMAAQLPGGRFVQIPAVGHLSNLEAPHAFVQEVSSFLAGQA